MLPASVTLASDRRDFARSGPEAEIASGDVHMTMISASRTASGRLVVTRQPGSADLIASSDSSRRVHRETSVSGEWRRIAFATEPPMRPGPRIATGRLRARERSYPSKGTSLRCREGIPEHPRNPRRANADWSRNRPSPGRVCRRRSHDRWSAQAAESESVPPESSKGRASAPVSRKRLAWVWAWQTGFAPRFPQCRDSRTGYGQNWTARCCRFVRRLRVQRQVRRRR